MANLQALMALGMPIAMFAGGIAAWRASKHHDAPPDQPAWRDDSLDDWRKERDAAAEAHRRDRTTNPHISTGAEEQQETAKHHQRLGG